MSPRKQLSISETERCEIKLENADLISVTRTLHDDGPSEFAPSKSANRRGSKSSIGSVDEQVAEIKTVIKSRKPVRKKYVDAQLSKPGRLDDKPVEVGVPKGSHVKPRKLAKKKSHSKIDTTSKTSPSKTKSSPGKRKRPDNPVAMTSLLPPQDWEPPKSMVWLKNEPADLKTSSKSKKQKPLSNDPNPVEEQTYSIFNNGSPTAKHR